MQLADLETLKQSSRLVHYCATPLLFDPAFRQQIQTDQQGKVEGKVSVSKCQRGWALCSRAKDGFAIFSQDRAALSSPLCYRMNLHPVRWRLRKSLGPYSLSPAAAPSLGKTDFHFLLGEFRAESSEAIRERCLVVICWGSKASLYAFSSQTG